ncbi:hypothetical protein ABG067_002823 [Albugo candida]
MNALIDVECEFADHNAAIHTMCFNERQNTFVSCDPNVLRLWKAGQMPGGSSMDGHSCRATQLRRVKLPSRTNCHIQAIVYIESRDLYIASAQDGTFRVYDNMLEELTSIHTSRGHIQCLAFDSKHQLLIAGGLDGCTAWRVRESTQDAGFNPLYELFRLDTYFKSSCKHLQAHLANSDRLWITFLKVDTHENKLFTLCKEHVEVFDTEDGRLDETLYNFYAKDLGALSSLALIRKAQMMVLGTSNGAIMIVSIHPTSVLNVFREHGGAVTSMMVHYGSSFLLSCSLDGTIRVWDLEVRQHVHCLTTNEHMYELGECSGSSSSRFYTRFRNSIRVYRIYSAVREFFSSLARITRIERVSVSFLASKSIRERNEMECDHKALVLIAAADNTIHILDGERTRQAPLYSWIPGTKASEIIDVSFHVETRHLFLLHRNQTIAMTDTQQPNIDNTRNIYRSIDCSLNPAARNGVRMISPTRPMECDIPAEIRSARRGRDSFLFANLTPEGNVQCLCCLHFTPILETHIQKPMWRNDTVDAKNSFRADEILFCTSHNRQSLVRPRVTWEERRMAGVRAPLEWIVCGTSSGELVFWNTECEPIDCMLPSAIVKRVHKDPVTYITASIATPCMVSCNTSHQYYIWHLQPSFDLKQIVSFQPATPFSCIGFSPISESMVAGYDDGLVLMIEYSELREAKAVDDVARFQIASELTPADEDHDTTVVAVDFLDEKAIFITASADAILKIWSSQKVLLRQLMTAMAVSSVRFINTRGDLLVASEKRAYTLIQDEIIPDHVRVMTLEQIGIAKERRRCELKREFATDEMDQKVAQVDAPVPEMEKIANTAILSSSTSKQFQSLCMEHVKYHLASLETPILRHASIETGPLNADVITCKQVSANMVRRLHIENEVTEYLAVV